MKHFFIVLAIAAACALPALAQINKGIEADSSAQYMASGPLAVRFWHFGQYSFKEDKASAEITKAVDNGLYPTGIEMSGSDQLSVVFARLQNIPGKDCYIKVIGDLGAVNQTIQKDIIDQGYMPMDIASTPKGLFVLYIPSVAKIQEWRLFRIAGSELDKLKAEAEKYTPSGFALFGISNHDGYTWGLMLKTDRKLFAGTELKGYTNDGEGFIKGLEFQTMSGSLPLGLMLANGLVVCNFSRGK